MTGPGNVTVITRTYRLDVYTYAHVVVMLIYVVVVLGRRLDAFVWSVSGWPRDHGDVSPSCVT